MCMNLENDYCRNECRDCVYYYEETDFCLNHMYNVKLTGEKCADKKSKADYPATTLISNEDLEFSEELTDFMDANATISDLFAEVKAINEGI